MHASDTVRYTRLTDHPYPIWLLSPNALPATSHGPISDLEKLLHEGGERPLFRGVSIDRLPTIITTGVDVEPSAQPSSVPNTLTKRLSTQGGHTAFAPVRSWFSGRVMWIVASAGLAKMQRRLRSRKFNVGTRTYTTTGPGVGSHASLIHASLITSASTDTGYQAMRRKRLPLCPLSERSTSRSITHRPGLNPKYGTRLRSALGAH